MQAIVKIHTTFILLFFFLIRLTATTYYVSPTGNNSNNGKSLASAFLTLQKGADVATTGDSVLIADGTYAGFDFRHASGTAGDPIVFKAIGNNAVITSKGPLRFDGINIEGTSGNELKYVEVNGLKIMGLGTNGNGVRVVFADHCIVRNCTSDGNERGIFTGFVDHILIEYNICSNAQREHGIYISNSSDSSIVRYNIVFGNKFIGIHNNGDLSQGEDGINHSPMIYGNHIYNNNLAAGINLDGVYNPMIFNNVIYNNHNSQGIILFKVDGAIVSSHAKIFNNTIIVPSDGRWGILIQNGGGTGTEIYNNIIANLHATRGVIGTFDTVGFYSDYNILQNKLSIDGDNLPTIPLTTWQTYGYDNHSYIVNNAQLQGLFTDYATNDFHLVSGSLAKDKGSSYVNSLVTNDLDGVIRPQGGIYDIGAFEYTSALAVSDISSLSVSELNDKVMLSWTAKVDDDNNKFEIERSGNGQDFYLIDKLDAQKQYSSYAIIDHDPLSGLNYYRIKTIMSDKSEIFSAIQSIIVSQNEIKIYPNPTNGDLFIEGIEKIKVIQVYGMDGRLLKTIRDIDNHIKLDLKSGIYFVVLHGDGLEKKIKLIVD